MKEWFFIARYMRFLLLFLCLTIISLNDNVTLLWVMGMAAIDPLLYHYLL